MLDISTGIKFINDSFYFEAHDFFEELWNDSESRDRLFFQALVQVSVGAYHLTNKNFRSAKSQYLKAVNKLKEYIPVYYNLDIEDLVNQLFEQITELEKKLNDTEYKQKINFPVIVYINN